MEGSDADRQEVLVGFDGTDAAKDAVALAQRLAAVVDGRVVVAAVYFVPRALDPANLSVKEGDEKIWADGMLTSAAALVDHAHAEYVAVGSSSAARGLHELAEKRDVVAIVVGSTHRGEVGRVAPGSVGRRLLGGAPCAVAIAPLGFADNVRDLHHIGVAYDGTDESDDALLGAVRFAPHVDGHIDLLGVVRWPGAHHEGVVASSDNPVEGLRAELQRKCEHAMQTVPDALRGRVDVRVGHPATVLEEQSADFDVLMCGSRAHGHLHEVLLGSVSAQLVDRARCAVIVVPRGGRRVDESRI